MTPPNTTPLNEEDRLGEILKPLSDNGYHNNSEDSTRSTCYDCKRIETAKQELTNLIQTLEKKARKEERSLAMMALHDTNRLDDYKRKIAQLEKGSE